jgi:hypothetical protein
VAEVFVQRGLSPLGFGIRSRGSHRQRAARRGRGRVGVINTFRELGGSIGVAVVSTLAATSFSSTVDIGRFTGAYLLCTIVAAAAVGLVPAGTPRAVVGHGYWYWPHDHAAPSATWPGTGPAPPVACPGHDRTRSGTAAPPPRPDPAPHRPAHPPRPGRRRVPHRPPTRLADHHVLRGTARPADEAGAGRLAPADAPDLLATTVLSLLMSAQPRQ